jgi:hypothetical protein
VLTANRSSSPATARPIDLGTRTVTKTPPATSTPTGPTPTPAPVQPPTLAALGPGIMVTECLGATVDSVRAIFLWTPSKAGTQFLDLSIFNDGFARHVRKHGGYGPRCSATFGTVCTTHFARHT